MNTTFITKTVMQPNDIAQQIGQHAWPWQAADFPQQRRWAMAMPAAMRADVDANVDRLRHRNFDWRKMRAADFPLQDPTGLLGETREQIERGRGFAVISNLPVTEMDESAMNLMVTGICSHIGRLTAQTHRGDLMIDVIDRNAPYDHTSRGYSSNKALPFHTDGADVAALLCIDNSASGGQSVLVSAASVYQCIARERPDLLSILKAGFHHHRRGEQAPGEAPLSPRPVPVFSFHESLLHCMYNRNPIEWSEKEGVRLTPTQREALDFFDAVCQRESLQLAMDMRPGDLQFVNNFTILHSRSEYRDSAHHRRHLKRLWLSLQHPLRRGPTLLDLYAPNTNQPTDSASS